MPSCVLKKNFTPNFFFQLKCFKWAVGEERRDTMLPSILVSFFFQNSKCFACAAEVGKSMSSWLRSVNLDSWGAYRLKTNPTAFCGPQLWTSCCAELFATYGGLVSCFRGVEFMKHSKEVDVDMDSDVLRICQDKRDQRGQSVWLFLNQPLCVCVCVFGFSFHPKKKDLRWEDWSPQETAVQTKSEFGLHCGDISSHRNTNVRQLLGQLEVNPQC